MTGLGIFVKLMLALLLVAAAVTGLEVVDVVVLAEDVTDRARAYVNDVELDGDETALFDERIDSDTGERVVVVEFARPSDKDAGGVLAYAEGEANSPEASLTE